MIAGCPLRCAGCHSADSWNASRGTPLDPAGLSDLLAKYQHVISCVLFLGGEWHEEELIELLACCRQRGLKTALYTGQDDVADSIKKHLTFLKTGSWNKDLGGLNSPHTNQKLTELATGTIIKFKAQGGHHGQIDRTAD